MNKQNLAAANAAALLLSEETEQTIERYLATAIELDQHHMPLMAKWFRARARELEIQRDKLD